MTTLQDIHNEQFSFFVEKLGHDLASKIMKFGEEALIIEADILEIEDGYPRIRQAYNQADKAVFIFKENKFLIIPRNRMEKIKEDDPLPAWMQPYFHDPESEYALVSKFTDEEWALITAKSDNLYFQSNEYKKAAKKHLEEFNFDMSYISASRENALRNTYAEEGLDFSSHQPYTKTPTQEEEFDKIAGSRIIYEYEYEYEYEF